MTDVAAVETDRWEAKNRVLLSFVFVVVVPVEWVTKVDARLFDRLRCFFPLPLPLPRLPNMSAPLIPRLLVADRDELNRLREMLSKLNIAPLPLVLAVGVVGLEFLPAWNRNRPH